MHLLYFFNHRCPHVLHVKFQAVPTETEGVTANFPISANSQFTVSGGKIRLCTCYASFVTGVPTWWARLKMAQISDFLVFSDTAKEQHQCPLKRFNIL